MTQSMIKNIPPQERPRERCLEIGGASLSAREVLTLILGSSVSHVGGAKGLAQILLENFSDGKNFETLFPLMEEIRYTPKFNPLFRCPGIGPAQASRLLATFEFAWRYFCWKSKHAEPPKKSLPAVRKIPREFRLATHEWIGFIPVFMQGRQGEFQIIEKGSRHFCTIEPLELFAKILAHRPLGFMLFHNHPSGILRPSEEDLYLTKKIEKASLALELRFLGHWIVTAQEEILVV